MGACNETRTSTIAAEYTTSPVCQASRTTFRVPPPVSGSLGHLRLGYAGGVNEPELLKFPCAYPIKVMARAEAGLRARLDAIVERHAGPEALTEVRERPSAQANFVGITYVIHAENEAQIAALFAELKQCQGVLMVL